MKGSDMVTRKSQSLLGLKPFHLWTFSGGFVISTPNNPCGLGAIAATTLRFMGNYCCCRLMVFMGEGIPDVELQAEQAKGNKHFGTTTKRN